jgi:hypothetical protein
VAAHAREGLLLPEIERQQRCSKPVVFPADAALAKPEIEEGKRAVKITSPLDSRPRG